jgi:outer membrane protein assembly factor BamD
MFDNFRRVYGRSPFLEDAEFMYAMGYYYSSPPPTKDQSTTIMAITSLSEYLSRYPNGAKYDDVVVYITELQDRIREKEYLNAYTYYKIGQYRAAVITFRNALDKFPDSKRREEIMYLTVKSAFLLAENSVENLQKDRYLTTMDYYYTFLSEYPDSQYLKELDRMQDKSKRFISGSEVIGDTVTGDTLISIETIITE